LHLKSAVTLAADGLLLMNPAWVDRADFEEHDVLEVDPTEPNAANVLRIGDEVVASAAFPRTVERLASRGLVVHTCDMSELAKAEGAVTCCSLIFQVP
jgi:dimethylargininase